ncbi:MAG: DUF2508 family protein [Clostridia bacterium]|nr:DUF2508 family protein [Clostridia bacterium]
MTLQLTANLVSFFDKNKAAEKKVHSEYLVKLQTLKQNIDLTRCEITAAMENFNNVNEPKLIDFYIYKIQSEQNRYEQLLMEYKALERSYSALIAN